MTKFDDLFVEKGELNRELLKKFLTGRVRLTQEGEVIFEEDYDPKKRILLYLLANKVFVEKGIKQEEAEGPTAISRLSGVAKGTATRYVRLLEEERILVRTSGAKYFIPNHAFPKLTAYLNEDR